MNRFFGPKCWLLAAIILAFVVSCFTPQFNRYYLGIGIDGRWLKR